ncbi:hypothetical protein GCM10009797_34660 [Nocardioides hwasunensis]
MAPPAHAGTVHAAVDLVRSERPGTLRLAGWAFDDAAPSSPLAVHVYVGGPAGSGAPGYVVGSTDQPRQDVADVYGVGPNQGIDRTVAVSQHGPQAVYVYFLGPTQTVDLPQGVVTIADVPPETAITAGPPVEGTDTSVAFAFRADEPSTFRCRLDQAAWEPCTSPAAHTVAVGAHTFEVVATNAAGTVDPSPAAYAFTVVAPAPPPPPAPPSPPPPPPAEPRITVTLKALKKSRLRIDVDPNLNPSNYRLTIQRKRGRSWRPVSYTQTLGPKDRMTVTLTRGRYRVVVPRQHGMAGTSATIRLKR